MVASNGIWRSEADYWDDFRALDLGDLIDAVVFVAQAGGYVGSYHGPLPRHAPPHDHLLVSVATARDAGAKVLLRLAQDVERVWWDVDADRSLDEPPEEWWERKAAELGLQLKWPDRRSRRVMLWYVPEPNRSGCACLRPPTSADL